MVEKVEKGYSMLTGGEQLTQRDDEELSDGGLPDDSVPEYVGGQKGGQIEGGPHAEASQPTGQQSQSRHTAVCPLCKETYFLPQVPLVGRYTRMIEPPVAHSSPGCHTFCR